VILSDLSCLIQDLVKVRMLFIARYIDVVAEAVLIAGSAKPKSQFGGLMVDSDGGITDFNVPLGGFNKRGDRVVVVSRG
jgi:hypothetical protein